MTICPTCSQPVPPTAGLELRAGALFSSGGCLRLGPVATGIVRALMSGPLTTPQLVERVYGYADDAPEFPKAAINVTVAKLRRRLPEIGWTISGGGGGRGGGIYRLVRTVPDRKVA